MTEAQILFGRVFHCRRRPVRHAFSYGVFCLRVPLSVMARAGRGIFSVDRWNLLSLMSRDHGPRDGSSLEPWVRARLAAAGVAKADGEIVLQAFPRVLGYVFNPIAIFYCHDREGDLRAVLCEVSNTFGERHNYLLAHRDARVIGPRDWLRADKADGEIVLQAFPRVLGYVFNPIAIFYCHDREGGLRAVLCEVSNTFGERHNYLLAHRDARPIGPRDWMRADKVFHVSPFCEVEGHYRFRFAGDARRQFAQIDYHDRDGKLIVTAIDGMARPIRAASLAKAFLGYPLMTAGVVARIHWQALRLWIRRVPWFSKPEPPLQETTR